MIKLENTVLPSADQWKAIIFGARNPLNSWDRSDSFCVPTPDNCSGCHDYDKCAYIFELNGKSYRHGIGPSDLKLMSTLRNAGTDHRKFMRMITVYLDITAPLYWWKEFDTYKVGTVANSCSTMHKIADKEFMLEDFSHEHLGVTIPAEKNDGEKVYQNIWLERLKDIVEVLNIARGFYIRENDPELKKCYWWQMIQLLPSSYNQRRTVMLNYEVLANIYKSRKNHKLDEWRDFCRWIKALPYSQLITGEFDTKEEVK